MLYPVSQALAPKFWSLQVDKHQSLDLRSVEKLAPNVQPALLAIALDGPTKHGIYVLRNKHDQ